MNIILYSEERGRARQFSLRSPRVIAFGTGLLLLTLGVSFVAGSMVGAQWLAGEPARQLKAWSTELGRERADLEAARGVLQRNVDALAMRVGQMNARVIRLDALGKRLTEMAKLNKGEFNFESAAPVGGLDPSDAGQAASAPLLTDMLDRLAQVLANREQQLGALENVILTRELRSAVYPQGRPLQEGYISSFFGQRVDPISGYMTFHAGVDFAGESGAQVVSVATGVVIWSGERMGYGNLVEVNHGNGYVTRYAHNSANLVKAGDTVQKGQLLALVGTTGHSTGPHVHFEVLRDGAAVDPMTFIDKNEAQPLKALR